MNNKIFILFSIICFLTVCIHLAITYAFTNDFFEKIYIRRHELKEITQYAIYLSSIKDTETGQRGFVITGNPQFLIPYNRALGYLNSPSVQDFIVEELKDPTVRSSVQQLEKLKEDKLNELARTIKLRQEQGFEAAKNHMIMRVGDQLMSDLRRLVNEIVETKQEYLRKIDESIQLKMSTTILLLGLSDIIAALFLSLCLYYIYSVNRHLENKDKELSSALQQLHETSAFQHALLSSAGYAIISVDEKGIITSFNPAAEKMLGYTSQELVRKVTPAIFHDPQEIEARAIALSKQFNRKILPGFDVFTILATDGGCDINEWTYIRKDGSTFPVELSVVAVKNNESKIIGYMGIAYNISERRQVDRMKNELIAIAGYELRSPVVSIKGTFELLSRPELNLSDQANKVLALGQKSCVRLVQLTEDILEIQKIETGKVQFHFKKLLVTNLLSKASLVNSLITQYSKVILNYQTIPSDWTIEADEDRLLQALNHLISNAVKYSHDGGTIEIGVSKMDSKMRFEITDQGSDISSPNQSTVVQKFSKDALLTNIRKREVGLELSITRSIIEKHKGKLGVESNSKGTTVWFELPIFVHR